MAAHRPVVRARERARLASSAVDPFALFLIRALGPLYAKVALRIDGVELRHADRLVEAWREFQEGRARLILAFRHPYGDEPQLFSRVFDVLAPREARRLGAPLPLAPHARFVHGYEVPLWSGPLVRWLLPRIGAVPVYHVRFDSASVARLRSIAREGPHPLALAPEGQVSYRSETLPRIESGTARLAFWCAEDLEKAGGRLPVLVLPLSVHYRYDEAGIGKLEAFVARLERTCGLGAPRSDRSADRSARSFALKARLVELDLALLSMLERFYGLGRPGKASDDAVDRDKRLDEVLETALARAEAMLGIGAEGADRIARVYRIRQEGWDRIYPDRRGGKTSPLERALADRRAGEAWYAMRHMETVDLANYLDGGYLDGPANGKAPSFGRLVESAYSLADLASRLVGGDISHRPNFLRKRAIVFAAGAIDLGARYPEYSRDRRAAVEDATADLAKAYMSCIEEYLHERSED